jgi:serine/threonine-protein kinase
MNRLGDAPTDLLFGLIALHNDLVAPAVIPAALKAQAREPERTLADVLVSEGALSTTQCELVEKLSAECVDRHGGDTEKSLATVLSTPSTRQRLDRLGDPDLFRSLGAVMSARSADTADLGFRLHDQERTLLPSTGIDADSTSRIAGYEIIEVLGAGGMGIVYKARQPRLDRFVALKMIRAGAGALPEDIARFESEAKAVAAIEHPNIVRIFEIGEQDGLPYFSLEYLAGGSLAQKIGGVPQPVHEAARTVEVLARAIHVAHQHKVVHRDLKPSNVLFAADGTPKITDFGLVKRLEDDSGQTRSGSVLGTPSYMAPEQAWGDTQKVGPGSDQYALGAILYELLTGRPPFQGTTVFETLDMVRNNDPVPPSQLQPKTPRDIETICLKCLEKDISRRYSNALELAEDLRRFREGETILARPVSDAERLWRWCKRNRRVAYLSAAVVLLLLVVAAGSAIAAATLGQKNQALGQANALAEDKRREAERKEKLAVAAARAANLQNRSAVEAQVDLILLMERKLRHVPAIQDEREQILDKAASRLEAAARAMTDLRRDVDWGAGDEEFNWRALARAHQALARLSISRNKLTEAVAQLHQAEEIIIRVAEIVPGDLGMQVNLLRTQRQLGDFLMFHFGDSVAGQEYLRKAIAISRACLAKKPDADLYKSELANSLGLYARSERKLGRLEQARELYKEEVATRDSFSQAQANDWESRRELAGHYADVATLNLQLGDLVEGQRLYDKAAALREEVAALRPGSWPELNDLALSYNQQGSIRYPQGSDPAAARQFHKKALEIFEKRAKADPQDFENLGTLAWTLYYDACCALKAGDKDDANAEFHQCLEIRRELAKETQSKILKADLMIALARCGLHAEAVKIAQALLAVSPDESLYMQCACGYALAADAAKGDAELVKQYTAAAVDCLRKAKERGWTDVANLKTDTDLEPIRSDPGFQAVLAEFERAAKKQP